MNCCAAFQLFGFDGRKRLSKWPASFVPCFLHTLSVHHRLIRWFCVWVLACLCVACGRAQPVLERVRVLELPYAIQSMAWHPNGKWLAVGYFMRDEVEVWDVETGKPLFAVPSQRRPPNQSGQEVLFSKDGKYLVVQDFKDTKNGEPKFPRAYDDPAELPARQDKERYVLGRVWDTEKRQEVAQLKGPGSILYAGVQGGMCLPPIVDGDEILVMLRGAVVSVYAIGTGEAVGELNLQFPFADKPGFGWGYVKMFCHPARTEVALVGGPFMRVAPMFGYPINSGATPIVIVDLDKKAIKKVLYSATPLNGVVYTADGGKLISFGAPPILVWDANADFAAVGEIDEPHLNSGLMTPIPGYDGFLGISNALRIWSVEALRNVYTLDTKEYDTFRIALHAQSNRYAVAVTKYVHLYRLNQAELRK